MFSTWNIWRGGKTLLLLPSLVISLLIFLIIPPLPTKLFFFKGISVKMTCQFSNPQLALEPFPFGNSRFLAGQSDWLIFFSQAAELVGSQPACEVRASLVCCSLLSRSYLAGLALVTWLVAELLAGQMPREKEQKQADTQKHV